LSLTTLQVPSVGSESMVSAIQPIAIIPTVSPEKSSL